MAEPGIKSIEIGIGTVRSGFRRQRITVEEHVTLNYEGGSCFMRQSTLEATGDSWKLFKKRLKASAQERGIPYRDPIG